MMQKAVMVRLGRGDEEGREESCSRRAGPSRRPEESSEGSRNAQRRGAEQAGKGSGESAVGQEKASKDPLNDHLKLLLAAAHALRSYQYGNSSPELAKEIADEIDGFLLCSGFSITENRNAVAPGKLGGRPSRLSLLVAHLLKWQFQPDKRGRHGRSWRSTIDEQRRQLKELTKEMPSLAPLLSRDLAHAHKTAVILASRETGRLQWDFPQTCPYSMEQIMDENWLPE
jgi:uncharacterized protein DUF29